MLDGVNDLPEHARQLAALLDPRVYKVNLIPYNPTGVSPAAATSTPLVASGRRVDIAKDIDSDIFWSIILFRLL
jgi:hypothetical protein